MSTPTISILIPTFSRARLLRQTLDSVAAQTLIPEGLQVVVSDDGSTDETWEVLEEYRSRTPYLEIYRHEKNIGPVRNWKFVLEKARGELVYLLCDDDAIAVDFLESMLGLFRDDPELDMAFGDIELRGVDSERLDTMPLATPEGLSDGPTRCREQLRSHHMVMSTVYRRSTLLAAGGWDGDETGTHLDCTAFCRAALRSRRTYRLPRPMLYFRVSPVSWGRQLKLRDQSQPARWYRRKLDLLVDDAQKLAPDLVPFLKSMYAWHVSVVLVSLEIEHGNGRIDDVALRGAMRELLDTFPEGKNLRMAWKLWLVSYFGIRWLTVFRIILRRSNPYKSSYAIFNRPTTRDANDL